MQRKSAMSYHDLEIWKSAHALGVIVHKMTLEKMPKFEMYEEGSQIRRSSKAISVNIVEGFGRRRYKNDFIRFLTYALASCDETREHLEYIVETGSMTDRALYEHILAGYDVLGRKVNSFLRSVIESHMTPKSASPSGRPR